MASAPPLLANRASTHGSADFRRALVGVVDSVPETRGIGAVLIESGRLHRLRAPDAGEATVVSNYVTDRVVFPSYRKVRLRPVGRQHLPLHTRLETQGLHRLPNG